MKPLEISMIVFGLFALISFVIFLINNRAISVKPVSAGIGSANDFAEDVTICQLSKEDIVFYKTNGIDSPGKYNFRQVQGNCMHKKGILKDDIVVIKMFPFYSGNRKKKSVLKEGDVVFIDFKEKKSPRRIKLREYRSAENEVEANTQYYENDGSVRSSSKTHKFKDIRGIVHFIDHRVGGKTVKS